MVFLWGLMEDPPMRLVVEALQRKGVRFWFLNHIDLSQTQAAIEFLDEPAGTFAVHRRTLNLSEVNSIYYRPYDLGLSTRLQQVGAPDCEALNARAIEYILWTWLELTRKLVVNKPSASASNESKPLQAAFIADSMFATPATLLTTDLDELHEFWRSHGRVIYKSISGARSTVRELSEHDAMALMRLDACPTQFQQYVGGTDIRVHVAGGEVFACQIKSSGIDYRYAPATIEPVELPVAVMNGCISLTRDLGLHVAGIDLRHWGDRWYCFEVNPAPAFSFFEVAANLPISDAIARRLAEAA